MFDGAGKRVLLAVHTKFERRALHAMGGLNEFVAVIVDVATPPRQVERVGLKDSMFEPTGSKIYRHPTFYEVPDEVGHM